MDDALVLHRRPLRPDGVLHGGDAGAGRARGCGRAGGLRRAPLPRPHPRPSRPRHPVPGRWRAAVVLRDIYDPFIACAFAASATTALRVGVGVCLVPAREPIALAKEVATVDALSNGRFLFGVGAGWNAEELANHGVVRGDRWAIMRERILAMKAIWAEDVASFEGEHVRLDPLSSGPKPRQRPHPPILVGGHGPGVLERVVDYGDEWLAMVTSGRPPLAERIEELDALARAAGRGRLAVSVQVYGHPPDERHLDHYVAAGVDRIDLSLPHVGPSHTLAALGDLGRLVRRYHDRP